MKKQIQALKNEELDNKAEHLEDIEKVKFEIKKAKVQRDRSHEPYTAYYENKIRNLEYLLKDLEGKPC